MEKFQLEDEPEVREKLPVSNEDLHDLLLNLTNKIDRLTSRIDSIEKKINKITAIETNKLVDKNEVEIEEQLEYDEDYLTPTDLVFENEATKNSGMKLISFRIATASEIANITKKDRAVESLYLNDLWSRNKVRKLRIGRKIYFYTGRLSEIKPFKNSIIKQDWRDILISIIRDMTTFSSNRTVKIEKILKNYFILTHSDDTKPSDLNPTLKSKLEKEIKEKLREIAEDTQFIKFDPNEQNIEFIVQEWMKLG